MAALELLVVQDMFLNETARAFAHVIFPACSSFEKDGTFMNAERRIQRVRKAVTPMGHSRPDWEIICAVARAMGKGNAFAYRTAEAIWDEVRAVWNEGRGISYARIEDEGLQWPCPSEDHPGTEILHRDSFAGGARARLRAIEYRPTEETTNLEYPFLLTTGRTLHQFNAGTMTGRTANTVLRPTDLLEMAPADATRLALHDGERVRLVEPLRRGRCCRCRSPDASSQASCSRRFTRATVFLNHVIGPHRDRFAGTPEYKVTAVNVERLTASRTGRFSR